MGGRDSGRVPILSRYPRSLLCLFTIFWLLRPAIGGESVDKVVPPPPPYVFSLGGLSDDQIERLKSVPGVVKVSPVEGRVQVIWQPYNDKPWESGQKELPLKDLVKIHDFLAIKTPAGKTQYTDGGAFCSRAGTIIHDPRGSIKFNMMFNDIGTRHSEVMSVYLYNQALAGQVEHEMLRDVPGTKATIEKCGDGYAIVSRSSWGTFVVWQVSDQMFVRIDNSFDPEMVAAYVHRLGSITPKSYDISVDKWVVNEIRWRVMDLDQCYMIGFKKKLDFSPVWGNSAHAGTYFPEIGSKVGVLQRSATWKEDWDYLYKLRRWLWANRENFKYHDGMRGYVLKGPDRYDPRTPPELSEENKDPPKNPQKP